MTNFKDFAEQFQAIALVGENKEQYWKAREYMPLLGYTDWQTFGAKSDLNSSRICLVQRTIRSCQESEYDIDIDSHFKYIARNTSSNENWELSAYACSCIAKIASKKPEISAAREYFTSQPQLEFSLKCDEQEIEPNFSVITNSFSIGQLFDYTLAAEKIQNLHDPHIKGILYTELYSQICKLYPESSAIPSFYGTRDLKDESSYAHVASRARDLGYGDRVGNGISLGGYVKSKITPVCKIDVAGHMVWYYRITPQFDEVIHDYFKK